MPCVEYPGYARSVRYGVADSALKHNVSYGDVVYVATTGDYLGKASDGLLWWVGPDRNGNGLEVAGIGRPGVVILIHAMPMKWRKR